MSEGGEGTTVYTDNWGYNTHSSLQGPTLLEQMLILLINRLKCIWLNNLLLKIANNNMINHIEVIKSFL